MGTFILFTGLSVTMYSCKKTTNAPAPITQTQAKANTIKTARAADMDVTVNARGFLSFNNVDEVDNLAVWLTGATHAEAKSFFLGKGFSPKALTMYPADDNLVTVDEAPYYLLNAANAIQVQGIIMKISNDNNYITTLTGANITDGNYAALAAGVFNISAMNRFPKGADGTYNLEDGFFAFNTAHPSGFNDSRPTAALPRFWGWHTNCKDNNNNSVDCHDDYYICFIRVKRGAAYTSAYGPL